MPGSVSGDSPVGSGRVRGIGVSAAALCLLALTGCAGTMLTRTDQPNDDAEPGSHSMFGGYPFQAVVVDYRVEERHINEGNSAEILGSLVVDVVIDTVLSPVDLVAWAFGCHKRAMRP